MRSIDEIRDPLARLEAQRGRDELLRMAERLADGRSRRLGPKEQATSLRAWFDAVNDWREPTPSAVVLRTADVIYPLAEGWLKGDTGKLIELSTLLTRAVADQATSDNVGVTPVQIAGELVKFVDDNRYAVSVAREIPMPAQGATYTRFRATQLTTAAEQSSQHTELSSQKMTIVGDSVTKKTYGAVLDISEQDIDWSSPDVLQLAIEDMAAQYGVQTEDALTTAIEAAVTSNNTDTAAAATAAQFYTALGTAVASCYGTAKRLPDVLFAAVDRWQYLVGLTDTAGQPAGHLKVATPDGREAALRLVVSPGFSSGFFAVGCGSLIEYAEKDKGVVTVPDPSRLSLAVAYRGYFGTYVRAEGLWGMKDVA